VTRRYLPPALVFVAILVVWEVGVNAAGIKGFLLPPPSRIIASVQSEWAVIWPAGLFTLREALGGLLGGTALAVLAGFAVARWSLIRAGALPFAIAAGSAPIIALAPITNQWFGITNPVAKMSVVGVMVFFPIMINLVRGLTDVGAGKLH